MACGHHRCIFTVGEEVESWAVWDTVALRHAGAVRHFSRERDCLRQLSKRACDLLIIDLEGSVRSRLELLVQARDVWPWQSTLVLVARGAVADAVEAMKAGATDCLEKPAPQDRLLVSIEQGLHRTSRLFASETPLTPTEAAVFNLIMAGKTSEAIANRLSRSKRTVDVHRGRICRKLGVRGLQGMVKWAISAGVINPREVQWVSCR